MKDEFGNEMTNESTIEGNKIIWKRIYTLEEGKETLRGSHKKCKEENKCAFPNRLDCNNGYGYKRCQYMKFVSLGIWKCTFEKGGK